MEIIYRAKDGKEFDNEADCVYHERQSEIEIEIEMYDEHGSQTKDVEVAMIVHLQTDEQTHYFRQLNWTHDIEPEGIAEGDKGWFYWDNDHYAWIDYDMVKAFRNLPL